MLRPMLEIELVLRFSIRIGGYEISSLVKIIS